MEVVWLGGLEMTQRSFQKVPCSDCLKTSTRPCEYGNSCRKQVTLKSLIFYFLMSAINQIDFVKPYVQLLF